MLVSPTILWKVCSKRKNFGCHKCAFLQREHEDRMESWGWFVHTEGHQKCRVENINLVLGMDNDSKKLIETVVEADESLKRSQINQPWNIWRRTANRKTVLKHAGMKRRKLTETIEPGCSPPTNQARLKAEITRKTELSHPKISSCLSACDGTNNFYTSAKTNNI